MKVLAKTRKAHYWNEDRFIIGNNFLMVIDGASPLIKNNSFNEARWLVSYLKKKLSKSSKNISNKLMYLSKKAYEDLPSINKSELYLPSACISWVEWDIDKYYVGILGDCEVTCVTNENKILRCYDDSLNILDKKAINKMVLIAEEKQIDVLKARPFINDLLIENRKLMNTESGYNVFAIGKSPKFNIKKYEFRKEDIKEIYLYSDGFSALFDTLKVYRSHEEMFSESLDISEEINKIVSRSFEDDKCNQYPRFKKIDDITVIKMIKEM